MKILFVSPPFAGHALVLIRVARHLKQCDSTLKITMIYLSWDKFQESKELVSSEDLNFFETIEIMRHPEPVSCSNPLIWCQEIQDALLPQLKDFIVQKCFDAVIYDAFCWIYKSLKLFLPHSVNTVV